MANASAPTLSPPVMLMLDRISSTLCWLQKFSSANSTNNFQLKAPLTLGYDLFNYTIDYLVNRLIALMK